MHSSAAAATTKARKNNTIWRRGQNQPSTPTPPALPSPLLHLSTILTHIPHITSCLVSCNLPLHTGSSSPLSSHRQIILSRSPVVCPTPAPPPPSLQPYTPNSTSPPGHTLLSMHRIPHPDVTTTGYLAASAWTHARVCVGGSSHLCHFHTAQGP